MDRITELLGRLADLSADELGELFTLIDAQAAELADADLTTENVEAITALAEAREQADAEQSRRVTAQDELQTKREEALARLRPAADTEQPETGDNPDADAEGDAEGDAQPETDADADQPQAVAAAAHRPAMARVAARRPAARAPQARQSEDVPQSRTTITAAASDREITTRAEVTAEVAKAIESTRGSRAGFKRTAVTALTEFPTDRRLRRDAPDANQSLVAAVVDEVREAGVTALVAAGGLCAPIESLYDVRVVGSVSRPVRDALTAFGADRGGVSLRPSPKFADWAGGVGVWDLQDDIDAATAGGDDPTKPIIEAACEPFDDFFVEAITARVRFRNVTSRFDPEGTAANVAALDVAHARVAENRLLAQIAAAALPVVAPKVLGAARDILVTVDRAIAYYRSRHRLDDTLPMRLIAPRWARDMLRADITRGELSMEALAAADAEIESWFTRRSVTPTWHLDGRSTAQAAVTGPPIIPAIPVQQYVAAVSGTAIPEFPDVVELLLYPEGDFLFLDGGTLDLGTVRDSGLNAVNAYELFKETFEGVAFRGVEALQVVQTTDPTGLSAGRIDTNAVSD